MGVKPISVSQVNSYIRRVLQSDPVLGNISVIGEVSNLTYHSSGHVYFTLKDSSSSINCFLAREYKESLRYQLDEGMEIVASGYIGVYEKGGRYSLNIREIQVEGEGNLAVAFERLKEKLEKEGLFDPKYKKRLPAFPRKLVIVTSETGAAVRDIIKVLRSRTNLTDILVYPCLVQGAGAAADIAFALNEVNRLFPDTDLIITGRGGGSMEDLWAFNEEAVARSIFLSEIPVISAVGHERDFTIADLVADRRAATPTEAAQIAVPDMREVRETLRGTLEDLKRTFRRALEYKELRLKRHDMESLRRDLDNRLNAMRGRIQRLREESLMVLNRRILDGERRMSLARGILEGGNPFSIMERGYAMILSENGGVASSALAFSPGDSLTIRMKDGKVTCGVKEIRRMDNGKERR